MADSVNRGLAVKQALPLGRVRRVMAQAMRASVQTTALSQVTREAGPLQSGRPPR
jgi:hypothetical protein